MTDPTPDQAVEYDQVVNAPLSEEAISALGARLAAGDYPVRKVHATGENLTPDWADVRALRTEIARLNRELRQSTAALTEARAAHEIARRHCTAMEAHAEAVEAERDQARQQLADAHMAADSLDPLADAIEGWARSHAQELRRRAEQIAAALAAPVPLDPDPQPVSTEWLEGLHEIASREPAAPVPQDAPTEVTHAWDESVTWHADHIRVPLSHGAVLVLDQDGAVVLADMLRDAATQPAQGAAVSHAGSPTRPGADTETTEAPETASEPHTTRCHTPAPTWAHHQFQSCAHCGDCRVCNATWEHHDDPARGRAPATSTQASEAQKPPQDPATTSADDAALCYVGHGGAYFTTQPLTDQWGDDWDDAPYDLNAGTPYLWDPEFDGAKRARPRWSVFEVEFTGPFDTPAGIAFNTPFSVDDINAGIIAWLWAEVAGDDRRVPERVVIPAGTTLARFRELVARAGGAVGVPVELKHWRETEPAAGFPQCGHGPDWWATGLGGIAGCMVCGPQPPAEPTPTTPTTTGD